MSHPSHPLRTLLVCAGLALGTPLSAQLTQASSHQKAAKELFMLVGGTTLAQSSAESMVNVMSQTNPGIRKHRQVISDWCTKVFTQDAFIDAMSALYAKHFSEQEIADLIKFYRTDLGKKAIRTLPIVMKEGMEVGAKFGQLHNQELVDMLTEAMKAEARNP